MANQTASTEPGSRPPRRGVAAILLGILIIGSIAMMVFLGRHGTPLVNRQAPRGIVKIGAQHHLDAPPLTAGCLVSTLFRRNCLLTAAFSVWIV